MGTKETIFSIEHAAIRFGPGALEDVGEEARTLGLTRVLLVTDARIRRLPFFETVRTSLHRAGVEAVVFDRTEVEPTDVSMLEAARAATEARVDGFISLGGGSVMDTAKAANLFSTWPAEFLSYVAAPLGESRAVPGPLKPHIACPTTFGTGAENTGIAIFDVTAAKVKTGIVSRRIRPTLGILDPTVLTHLPARVVAANGFDVLSHAMESFSAKPYTARQRPPLPSQRPMTQGANPYSAVPCLEAIRLTSRNLVAAVTEGDPEARSQLMFAGLLAGIGFGNSGCHLPHAMSYPVAKLVRSFRPEEWGEGKPLVPHGMAVAVNAPAALRWLARAAPERFAPIARALEGPGRDDHPGDTIAGVLLGLMRQTGIPVNLAQLGFDEKDIGTLAKGALEQKRLVENFPGELSHTDMEAIFREGLFQGESAS
ncbi:hydroxyacid-oxoacid transhydrogenase [Telmatospirillum siberiense]|nr:hydroxyacid-oxoacid transhydrogenase [Telmatospirillum siberiense]